MKKIGLRLFLPVVAVVFTSCVSIEDIAVDKLSGILASDSGGAVFTGDNDPELVADALPFALKMYEMILGMNPDDPEFLFATGKNFVMYANAFIQTPAEMRPDEEYREADRAMKRAKRMYLRGRRYLLRALEARHPAFLDDLEQGELDAALAAVAEPQAAPLLYWTAAAWIGAYSCDPFDFELSRSISEPVAFLFRALRLDPEAEQGAVDEIFIQLYGAMPEGFIQKSLADAPESCGNWAAAWYADNRIAPEPEARALFHFDRAMAISGGSPAALIAAARNLAVPKQDPAAYRAYLERVLAYDPADYPDRELLFMIYREKAEWLLDRGADFFIEWESGDDDGFTEKEFNDEF